MIRPLLIRVIAILVTLATNQGFAAVYSNGTDLDAAVARAQPYIASNGGPAVTIAIYSTNGALLTYGSGSLMTSPDGQNRTVLTAAHYFVGALNTPSDAVVVVFTGSNMFTDPGLAIPVSEILIIQGDGQNV